MCKHNILSILFTFLYSSNIIIPRPNLYTVKAFNVNPSYNHKHVTFYRPQTITTTTQQYAKPKNNWMNEEPQKREEIKRPENEFSRIVSIDSVLSYGTTASRKTRNYSISIEAKPEELDGLAKRFKLPEITKLEADLILKKDSGTTSGTSSKGELIQAEGTVTASLSQICIRSNAPFETELSFKLFAAVRTSGSRDDILSNITPTKTPSNIRPRKKKKRNSRKNINFSNVSGNSIIDEIDIQDMAEDIDFEDDLIEDDAVCNNGNLDVGELVAQMFRLKLDPFPKSPDSKPVDVTFSG